MATRRGPRAVRLVLPISACISDEALYRRSHVTTHSKAWDDKGVVSADVIPVAEFDERADAAVDLAARRLVSGSLGHSRTQIASVNLGSSRKGSATPHGRAGTNRDAGCARDRPTLPVDS